MKKIVYCFFFVWLIGSQSFSQVAIGTGSTTPTPDPAAVLLLQGNGTSQGLIVPVVQNVNASAFGKEGMVVFDKASGRLQYHTGTGWVSVGGGSGSVGLRFQGNVLSLDPTGTSSIGLATPAPGSGTDQGRLLVWDGAQWATTPRPTAVGQVLQWNGTSWQLVGASTGTVTNVSAQGGTPLSVTNGTTTPVINISQANASTNGFLTSSDWNTFNNKLSSIPTLGGDISGTLPATTVTGLRGQPISSTVPSAGQVLQFTGGQWTPQNLTGGGTVTNVTASAPLVSSGGATPDISLTPGSVIGQVLRWNGTTWVAALPSVSVNGDLTTSTSGITVVGGTGAVNGVGTSINIQNATAAQNGLLTSTDWNTFNNKLGTGTTAGGDLSGTYPSPSVTSLRGQPISATAPTAGQVLQFTAGQWTPQTLTAGTVTNVTGSGPISVVNGTTTPAISLNLTASDIPSLDATKITTGVFGTAQIPGLDASKVTSGILPVSVGGTGRTTWNGLLIGAGATINDISNGSNGQVLTISGGNPTWQTPTPGGAAGGSLAGTYPNPTIAAGAITTAELAANSVATVDIANLAVTDAKINDVAPGKITQSGASTGQVLKWNGTAWAPAADNVGGGGAPTLNPGQIIVGDGTSNSAATVGQDASLNSTNGNITVQGLRGRPIAATVPTTNSVYQYDGTQWTPVVLSGGGTVSNIATGTGLTGGPITATGTISVAAGGIGTTELANTSVTTAKLAANAVTTSQIVDGTITDADVAASAAIAVTKLATGTNGQVLTVSGGVPTWQTSSGLTNPMTTPNDLIIGGTAGAATRLAAPGNSQLLTTNGSGAITWVPQTSFVSAGSQAANLVLASPNGSAGVPTYRQLVNADISASAAIAGTKISANFGAGNISTTGTLTVSGGTTLSNTSLQIGVVPYTWPGAQGAAGTVLTNNGSGTLTWTAPASGWSLTGNAGTNPATNFVGTTDAQPLRFATGVGGVERMRIDAAGNVGIGTASPSANTHIVGTGILNFIKESNNTLGTWDVISNTSTGGRIFSIISTGSGNGGGPGKLLFSSNASYGSTIANIMALDHATGYVGIGTNTPIGKLHVENSDWASGSAILTSTAGSAGATLRFTNAATGNHTYDIIGSTGTGSSPGVGAFGVWDDTAGSYRLVISPSGNVGIGTTAPTSALDVQGFTQLGDIAPAIKVAYLTGTTAATEGGIANISFAGITTRDKIISINVMVDWSGSGSDWIQPGWINSSGFNFNWLINSTTNLAVVNNNFPAASPPQRSNQILNKAIRAVIVYTP